MKVPSASEVRSGALLCTTGLLGTQCGRLSQYGSAAQTMIAEVALFLQLTCILSPSFGQQLLSTDAACRPGFFCKSERHCSRYLDLKDRLGRLNGTAVETEYYKKLASQVKERICNKAESGVCCQESVEVTNGNIVRSVQDIPFIARLTIKTGFADYAVCGASLIASQYLITAKHCAVTFLRECIDETDCVAHFRDLAVGPTNHETGQFYITITNVFEKEGRSDLAVVQLKHKVEEHEKYKLGAPLHPIKLATEEPTPGEKVLTAGWGVTGYNEGLSEELRSLELTITEVLNQSYMTHFSQVSIRYRISGCTQMPTTRRGGSRTHVRATQEDHWPSSVTGSGSLWGCLMSVCLQISFCSLTYL